MSTNTNLDNIRKLHRIDCKLISMRKKHEELPNSLRKLEEAVHEKEDALRDSEGQLKTLRSRYDRKELELKSIEGEIKKFESQLGAVKTNKEYTAVLSEIAGKKADVARIEDELLLVMDSIEQQQHAIEQTRHSKKLAEEDQQDHRGEISSRQDEIGQQLRQVEDERRHAAAAIPRELLHQYERILQKRGTTAVVPVVDLSCQGCFMKVTPEVQAQLLKNDVIIYCKTCSRIIYLENNA